jgi:uncharacterized protein YggE
MRAARIALLLLVVAGTGCAPVAAPAPDVRAAVPFVEAAGEAEIAVTPDQAVLTLGVATEAPTAQEAIDENARRMTAVVAALTAAGFGGDALTTRALALHPVYESRPQTQPRIVGYRATNQVQVKTSRPATIGRALDAGVKAGANMSAGLAFSLRDPGAAEAAALRLAVQDAQRRAAAMAEAAGKRLGRVLEVRTTDLARPLPYAVEGVRAMAQTAPPTPVEPGQLTVRARVLLRAELE